MKKILNLKLLLTLSFMYVMGTNAIKAQTVACPAGYVKPQLSSYSAKTVCPISSVNLNFFVYSSQIPNGCNVVWFKNVDHFGDPIDNSDQANTGIYYAFYYYPEDNCYSPASNAVEIETISCNDCTQNFLSNNPLIIGGDAPTPPTTITGLVFVKNDYKFESGTRFENATVLVEPNITIYPKQGSNGNLYAGNLSIFGSHFYACDKPWQGIKLYSTSNLEIGEIYDPLPQNCISSFIEDANIAVEVDYALGKQTANGDPSRIIIKNTIFNRNNISVKIHNLTDPEAWNNNPLPVIIERNLFTSRNFPVYPNNKWDNLFTILPYFNNPNNITQNREYTTITFINNNIYPEDVDRSFLFQDGAWSFNKPFAGIVLENNSCQDPIACTTPQAITIGSGKVWHEVNYPNVFDNLNFGINSLTTNFNVNNSIFQNLKDENIGIVASGKMVDQNSPLNYFVSTKKIIKNTAKVHFYGTKVGILLNQMDKANIEDCYFVSNLDIADANDETNYKAVYMNSTNFNDITIANNEVYNVKYPVDIQFFNTRANKFDPIKIGKIKIYNNEIAKQITNHYNPLALPPIGYVHLGVNIANVNVRHNNPVSFEIYDNKLIDVYNGIAISNVKDNGPIIINNTLSLIEDLSLTPIPDQFGIKVESGNASVIKENSITGLGFNHIAPNLNTTKNDVGILVKSQINNQIMCNDVMDCKKGFKFFGTSYSTFADNRMHPSNQIGFMLDNAIIGQQGNNDFLNEPDDVFTSNNSWIADANLNGNWIATDNSYTMFCKNSSPTQSNFIIKPGFTGQDPIAGGPTSSNTNIIGTFYDNNFGLTYSTLSDGSNINRLEWCNYSRLNERRKINKNSGLNNEIAEGSILIPNDNPNERLEVMQQQLYEQAKDQPTIAINEPIIQQFLADNQLSGFASIRLANHFNKQNNVTGIQQVLNNWGSNPSNFEQNYKTYYSWMVAIDSGGTVDTPMVFAMANKCPIKEGNVVYAARNLYNHLKKTMVAFADNCDGTAASKGAKENTEFIRLKQPSKKTIATPNAVKLYPSISNNLVNIDNSRGINKVEIINSIGLLVNSFNYNKVNHATILINQYVNGVYFVKVTDCKGSISIQKFIKN